MTRAQCVTFPIGHAMSRRHPNFCCKAAQRTTALNESVPAGKEAAACSGGADRDHGGIPSDVHKARRMGDSDCHPQDPAQHPAHLCSQDQGVQGGASFIISLK